MPEMKRYFEDLYRGKQLWTDGRVLILGELMLGHVFGLFRNFLSYITVSSQQNIPISTTPNHPPVVPGQQNAGKTSLRAALIDMETASGQRVTESNRAQIETVGIDMSIWKSNPTYTHDKRVIWRQILVPALVRVDSQILTSVFEKAGDVLTHHVGVEIRGAVLYINMQQFVVEEVDLQKSLDRVTFVASLLSSGSRSRFTIFSPRWAGVLRWLCATQKYLLKTLQTLAPSEDSRKIINERHAGVFASQYSEICWYYSGSWQNAKTLKFKSHAFFAELGTTGAYHRSVFHLAANGSKPRAREHLEHQYLDCECQNPLRKHGTNGTLLLSFRWKKIHKPTEPRTPTSPPLERSPKSRKVMKAHRKPHRKTQSSPAMLVGWGHTSPGGMRALGAKPSTSRVNTSLPSLPVVKSVSMRELGCLEFNQLQAAVLQSISSHILIHSSKQDAKVVDHKPYLLKHLVFSVLFYSRRRRLVDRFVSLMARTSRSLTAGKIILKFLMPVDITYVSSRC